MSWNEVRKHMGSNVRSKATCTEKVYHTLGTLGKKTKGGDFEFCETTHTLTLLLWEFRSEFTKLKESFDVLL